MERSLSAIFCILLRSAPFVMGADNVNRTLTALDGIEVGHYTLKERLTGVTVVLAEEGVVAGVDVRGSAPGTRETDLLDPVNTVEKIHAVVLSGGSAFGLDSASGVMRYLEERGIGYDVGVARVPIVPAAILFDLRIGDPSIRPNADSGYLAAKAASSVPVEEGNIGAGAGATVGKARGMERAMKGGIGSYAVTLPSGLKVAALVAVNALGDIVDPKSGKVIAGARSADGRDLIDIRLHPWESQKKGTDSIENTTIGVVATNARLTKAQANKIAQMAHDGLARTIYPAHTPHDGDALFALATGRFAGEADLTLIGTLAAEAVAESVVRAVRKATSIPGYPSASDLED